MLCEMTSNRKQLLALRHINSSRNKHLLRAHVKIKSSPRSLLQPISHPPRGNMRLIRLFVLAETDVAIDAHHDLLRRPDVHRRELNHGLVNFADQREHRGLQLTLVNCLALVKPDAVIVALQPPKKLNRLV